MDEEGKAMVEIHREACIGCGECVKDCISGALSLKEGKAVYAGACIHCGHCVAICPAQAVSIPAYDMDEVEPCRADAYRIDADTLLRAIKCRRSIRHFTAQKIAKEKLTAVVQAGRYTATGGNRQGCCFVLVQDELQTLKDTVWKGIEEAALNASASSKESTLSMNRFLTMRNERGIDFLFRNAPCVVYITAESPIDAGLAAQNMEMMAVAQGLGVLYNGFLQHATSANPNALGWLGVSDAPIRVCMLMGFPQTTYQRTAPRKKANVIWR